MDDFRRDITDAIRKLAHPVPNQTEIDMQSAYLLKLELRECPECNRKVLTTINRCPFCEGV